MSDPESCEGNYTHGVCLESLSCKFIMNVPRENRCAFSHDIKDCHIENTLFHYLSFLACHCNETDDQMYYCSLLYLCHLFYYFFIMVLLAEFFTPSLCYISNVLGLSENLAGATLLALGNGAPDMMTTMVEATTLGPEVVLVQVMGTSIHVTTLVVAIVVLTRPFKITPWPFFRTVIPILLILLWIVIKYGDGVVYLWETFIYLGFFFAYMLMYCLQECCMNRKKKKNRSSSVRQSGEPRLSLQPVASRDGGDNLMVQRVSLSDVDGGEHPVDKLMQEILDGERTEDEKERVAGMKASMENLGVDLPPPVIVRDKPVPHTGPITAALQVERQNGLHMLGLDDQAMEESVGNPKTVGVEIEGKVLYWKSKGLWKDFCRHMHPVDDDFWVESNTCHKILHLVEAPLLYGLKLFIPCVHEGILCNNWCKLLACIHCYTVPLIFLWAFSIHKFQFLVFVIVVSVAAGIGILLSGLIMGTAYVRRAPKYHIVFAFIGILVTVVIMYVIVNEVVAIVRAIGSVYGISTPLLCITILPWGNSIEDIMNGVHLAKAGYARMAYAGSYGTAYLVVAIGMFIASLFIVVFSGKDNMYKYTPVNQTLLYNAFIFLALANLSSLIIVPTMSYRLRKSYAFFLIGLDLMFIGMCVMIELKLV